MTGDKLQGITVRLSSCAVEIWGLACLKRDGGLLGDEQIILAQLYACETFRTGQPHPSHWGDE